ncbi:MAG: hypothetical protein WC631_01595 [Candidatus Paceibacterota bacterium]
MIENIDIAFDKASYLKEKAKIMVAITYRRTPEIKNKFLFCIAQNLNRISPTVSIIATNTISPMKI